MRARVVPSRRAALVFVGALGAVLALVLTSESARVPLRTPLVPRAARGEPLAIPLEGRESRHGTRVFRLALHLTDPAALAAHEELWLFLSSETEDRRLVRAELRARGSQCVLEAHGRERLGEDQPVVLVRSPACSTVGGLGAGALDLSVEVKGEGPVRLLGFRPASGAEPGKIQVPPSGGQSAALDVRGHFVWYPPTVSRIVLLNHMWRLAPGPGWLAGLVGAGIGLALAGSILWPTQPQAPPPATPAASTVLRAGAGAALLAASLALLYAVLTPPLCGPDEPYHLLGYADLTHNAPLAQDTIAWMAQTHLWRIRFEPTERFRTIDVGRPYVAEDTSLKPTEMAMRSSLLARLSRVVAPRLAGRPAPEVLFALRLLNVLIFALAVGGATALAVAAAGEAHPQWATFVFLFVPSLPFFAMHFSETALLCSAYVLFATGVVVLFLDGPRAHWAGALVGLGTGFMLAGGRSPWPLAGLVAFVLLGRVLLGSSGAASPRGSALKFWGGVAVGAALFFLTIETVYRNLLNHHNHLFTRLLPPAIGSAAEWLLGNPGPVLAFVALAGGLELALRRPRAFVAQRLGGRAARVVRWAAYAGAWAVVLSLAGSLLLSYPQLPLEPLRPLTALERVAAILATTATMFRLTEPNFLLASSFWVGFGWLDTMPGRFFQALIVALVAWALVSLLVRVARDRAVRRFIWLLVLGIGAMVSLVLYSLLTQDLPLALSGRYLIGWYLAILAVAGAALTFDGRSPELARAAGSGAGRAALLLMVAGTIHLYCLTFILRRYF